MSSGEADVIRDPVQVAVLSEAGDRHKHPSFSMGRWGFKRAAQFADWQIARFGYVWRCGWCKNLIEDEFREGGMLRYRHVEGTTTAKHDILPYRANS